MEREGTNLKKSQTTDLLIEALTPHLSPLGYEIVYLEIASSPQKALRIFIDWKSSAENDAKKIGIEDCVIVTKLLNRIEGEETESFIEKMPVVRATLKGAFDLEVSSPGIDRPLRSENDYTRFCGKEIRVQTYRPLKEDEIANPQYFSKNQKQKNFLGVLRGLNNGQVQLETLENPTVIQIPFQLIAKANIEPRFDFESTSQERAK